MKAFEKRINKIGNTKARSSKDKRWITYHQVTTKYPSIDKQAYLWTLYQPYFGRILTMTPHDYIWPKISTDYHPAKHLVDSTKTANLKHVLSPRISNVIPVYVTLDAPCRV